MDIATARDISMLISQFILVSTIESLLQALGIISRRVGVVPLIVGYNTVTRREMSTELL